MKTKPPKDLNKESDLSNPTPEGQSGTENNVSSDAAETPVSDETMKQITDLVLESRKGKDLRHFLPPSV